MHTALLIALAVALFVGPFLLVRWRYGKLPAVRTVNPYDPGSGYKDDVLRVIESARKHLTMVRGEIPFAVYDEVIAEALRRASRRGVEIALVCGPLVVVPEAGHHPVLTLVNEGVLQLYYAPRSQSPHFVEADAATLYWEAPHPPGATEREVRYIAHSEFSAPKYRSQTLAAIKSGGVIRVQKMQEYFVLLTPKQAEVLQKRAQVQGVKLDDLSGDEIRALAGKELRQ